MEYASFDPLHYAKAMLNDSMKREQAIFLSHRREEVLEFALNYSLESIVSKQSQGGVVIFDGKANGHGQVTIMVLTKEKNTTTAGCCASPYITGHNAQPYPNTPSPSRRDAIRPGYCRKRICQTLSIQKKVVAPFDQCQDPCLLVARNPLAFCDSL